MTKQVHNNSPIQTDKNFQIDKLVRLALVAAITYWSFQLLNPLLGILVWGCILAVALYPIYHWLSKQLGGHRIIAASFITLLSLLLIVGSLVLLTDNLVEGLKGVTERVRAGEQIVPSPPSSVQQWPLIGEHLYQIWFDASSNLGEQVKMYSSYFVSSGSYLLAKFATKGADLLLFIISIILSGYLMVQSSQLMVGANKLAKRIALDRGSELINIVKATIQNVSRGVIGIALLQALLFGLLLLFANIPAAGILSFIALILCIVQAGLILLVVPVAIWLFFVKSFTFALVLTILMILITLLDSFLKPLVLSRGLTTPMIVIFLGVIGGVLVHGLIGIFIGPVVLAIFCDLLGRWLDA